MEQPAQIALDKDFFRAWFHSAPDALIVISSDGLIQMCNEQACSFLGYKTGQLTDSNLDRILPFVPPSAWQATNNAIDLPPSWIKKNEMESFALSRNGRSTPVAVIFSDISSQYRNHIVVTLRDITAQRAKENQHLFLATIANNLHDPVIVSNRDYLITSWNSAAEQLFGWKSAEAVGRTTLDLLKATYPLKSRKEILEALEKNRFWKGEVIYHTKNNKKIPVLVTASHIKDHSGAIIGNLGVIRDITTLKNAERALQNINNKLEVKVKDRTQTLEKRETLFRSMVENNDAIITLLDKNLEVLYQSPYAGQVTGYALGERSKDRYLTDVHPEDQQRLKLFLEDLFSRSGDTLPISFRILHKKQHYIWLEGSFSNLLNDPGTEAIVVNLRDVSQRKEDEEKIRQSELHYRSIIEQANDAIIICNSSGDLLEINSAGSLLLGYGADELVQLNLSGILASPAETLQRFAQATAGPKKGGRLETAFLTKGGQAIEVEASCRHIDGGECIFILHDITERIVHEAQLKNTTRQLEQLTMHIQDVREEERKRVAREIHDELGQQLTAVKMDVAWIEKRFSKEEKVSAEKFRNIIDMLDSSNLSIRKILAQLRPISLETQSLVDAMLWLGRRFSDQSEIECVLKTAIGDLEIEEPVSTALFRIYQEALTNVVRHEKAKKVETIFTYNESELCLSIKDNGKGFDKLRHRKQHSFGLLGINERVQTLNGLFTIKSGEGRGTLLTVKIPYKGSTLKLKQL